MHKKINKEQQSKKMKSGHTVKNSKKVLGLTADQTQGLSVWSLYVLQCMFSSAFFVQVLD